MTKTDNTDSLNLVTEQDAAPKSFDVAQMVTCDSCLRANPPTRSSCIYCGAALATEVAPKEVAASVAVGVKSTASGDGLYLVLPVDQLENFKESSLLEIAALLQVKATELQNAIGARAPLPLLLAKTANDGETFAGEMRKFGLKLISVPEAKLDTNESFRKIRALEISDTSLTGLTLNSGKRHDETWDNIVLIVTGRLITSHVEVEEKLKRGSKKPSASRELSSDEPVLDVHFRSSSTAWRIFVNSFDFSCLGSTKRLTAFENSKLLLQIIHERAPNVQTNEAYTRVRPLLGNVWPPEKETRRSQLRHSGVGKREVATVTTTGNQTQFNNYSRLLHHLRLRELVSS